MNKKQVILLALGWILFAITGILFIFQEVYIISEKDIGSAYDKGYNSCQLEFKDKFKHFYPDTDIYSITGVITEINSDNFVIKSNLTSNNPFDKDLPVERTIKINDAQIVSIITSLTADITPTIGLSKPPEKEISFTDLNINDEVTVHSKENLKYERTIDAIKIIVNSHRIDPFQ